MRLIRWPYFDDLISYIKEHPKAKIFFLASGGRDSTAFVLEAHRLGIQGTMLFNNTGYERTGKEVLDRLKDITGYPLIQLKYDGHRPSGEILRESFLVIPQVLKKMRETGKYRKNYFYCCKALKHQPTERFLKTLDTDAAVLILGIKGADGSAQRRMALAELRKKGTYFRLHKTGRLYYYPLRDCTDANITATLARYDLDSIPSSGCRLCPVFVLFPGMRKRDPRTWLRSVTFARRLGVDFPDANQTMLSRFCTSLDPISSAISTEGGKSKLTEECTKA